MPFYTGKNIMIQDIIAYFIITTAFLYAFYAVYKIIMKIKLKKEKSSLGCSMGCSGCTKNL